MSTDSWKFRFLQVFAELVGLNWIELSRFNWIKALLQSVFTDNFGPNVDKVRDEVTDTKVMTR